MGRMIAALAVVLALVAGAKTQAQDMAVEPSVEAAMAPPPGMPGMGPVTNLPLPRYVSLKTSEGNARRGPGLTHRIDWVFTRAGMPLRVTAEYEHWRRVEDFEGAGGWVHYSLLSGVRSAMVVAEMADLHEDPASGSPVNVHAERGVIVRLLQCITDWCRIGAGGERGWVIKTALWGVDPDEVLE
ncbi:SH3-like domain-containing protein [Cereibacter ovatus]|uniref:SH3-like domain-containing protein n=1 Tax=Cereibacter ovatus TaxID=439529 RepID=A0A285CWC1_9RHOB|nr:SH3-like domain-containing protein [Cereibacter ovatus]